MASSEPTPLKHSVAAHFEEMKLILPIASLIDELIVDVTVPSKNSAAFVSMLRLVSS